MQAPAVLSQIMLWDDNSQSCLLPVIRKHICKRNRINNFPACEGRRTVYYMVSFCC